MDMIERVARAIAGVNGIGLDEANEAMWRVHEMEARAAIEAMREPTPEMHDQARDWSAAKYGKPIGLDASAGCWRAMISGALPGRQVNDGGEDGSAD